MGSVFSSSTLTPEEMGKVQDRVEEIINNNKVAVFSKSYCPYCIKAKSTLKNLDIDFFVMELDQEETGSAIQQYLAEKTGQRTVPNIFINQKHLGGCDSLMAAKADGSLQKLLK